MSQLIYILVLMKLCRQLVVYTKCKSILSLINRIVLQTFCHFFSVSS